MYSYVPMCFVANMTGDVSLGALTIFVFFLIQFVTMSFNCLVRIGDDKVGYRLYQIPRIITLPFRLAVCGMAALNVFGMMAMIMLGMGIEAIMALATFGFAFLDLRHDVMALFGHYLTTKFEIIEELPGNVYICRKIPRMSLGPSKSMWPEYLVGSENRTVRGLTIVVLAQGLLLELRMPTLKNWQSLRGPHKVYQTRTFNDSNSKTYVQLKHQMARERAMQEAVERAEALQARLEEKAREKEELQRQQSKNGLPGAVNDDLLG